MKAAFRDTNWVGCAGHQFKLVLSHVFTGTKTKPATAPASIREILDACYKVVTYGRRTTLKKKLKTTLKQYVEVRWDSRLAMLDSVYQNFDDILSIASGDAKLMKKLTPILSQKSRIGQIIAILEPFKLQREILSADKSPTVQLVLVSRGLLRDELKANAEDDTDLAELKKQLLLELEKTLTVTPLHVAATFLTPQYKNLGDLASDEEKDAAIAYLMSNLEKDSEDSESILSLDTDQASAYVRKNRFENMPSQEAAEPGTDDLSRYYDFQFTPAHFAMDLIDFWDSLRLEFPRLSVLAKSILSIAATSCSSERVFSKAGMTLTDKRSSLASTRLNESLFINYNYEFPNKA